MDVKELTEYFEHIRYQIVYYPADMSTNLPLGVGSGFMLDYKGEQLFVTADHVVNTHDNGYLNDEQFHSLNIDNDRILKILTSIVKTMKQKIEDAKKK